MSTVIAPPTLTRPGTSTPPPRAALPPRRRDVQGLRALAILLVVAYHAGLPVPGGFLGVDVFFVVSGFVITGLLARELEASGRIALGRFYVRRARRLLPALALVLAVIILLSALLSPLAAQRLTALTGLAASAFGANVYLLTAGTGYFDVDVALDPLLHTWTLGVEEQLYLVVPFLLLAAWRLRGRGLALVVLALLSAASLAGFLGLGRGWPDVGDPATVAFYATPARAWEFGAGALLALAAPSFARRPRAAHGLGAAGAGLLLAAVFWAQPASSRGGVTLAVVAGTCALVAAGTGSWSSRALAARPAVWIGELSYSWYLWHWPLVVFAAALSPAAWAPAAAAAASLLPAWLSLRYVENPIRYGERWHLPPRALALRLAACALVPAALCVGLLGFRSALATTSTLESWSGSQKLHLDAVRGCDGAAPLGLETPSACTWTAPAPRGELVLVGDSNAGQFTEPVLEAARSAGLVVTVATFSACPFVDVGVLGPRGPEGDAECRRFTRLTLAELLRRRPALVVTAARTDLYVEDGAFALRAPSGRLVRSPGEKTRLWQEGLRGVLAPLDAAGIPVLVVAPVPRFPRTAATCTALDLLRSGCGSSVSLEAVEERLARARRAESRAVAGSALASSLDLTDAICPGGRCSTSRDGVILYRDADHLSVEGALTLAPRFGPALEARARRDA
ncbi:MAG TPA: acyltransferase family protein [Gaiellaceae bacterium]|nr:acyltransferase family protein [Gaiellaceae bacterium]